MLFKQKEKVLFVYGTRPEAIKMAPLVKCFEKISEIELKICMTGQHREMLDKVNSFFNVKPDYDLNLMDKSSSLNNLFAQIIIEVSKVIEDYKPKFIFVHGDTASTAAAAIAAYNYQINVVHVEAGLRSQNLWRPWPEEGNRRIVTSIASLHYAPTAANAKNLLKEGIDAKNLAVTGNTVIDAVLYATDLSDKYECNLAEEFFQHSGSLSSIDYVLITGHRRENIGVDLINVMNAVRNAAKRFPEVNFLYPVHLNPAVQKIVNEILNDLPNIFLTEPLEYPKFVQLIKNCKFILTDSGGIQEEGPVFRKPVLVFRTETERLEAVNAGTVKLIGTQTNNVEDEIVRLLTDKNYNREYTNAENPYGDGTASIKISKHFQENFRRFI
jgi:UDP-N-acetylglucosamine 2-epimerase (non-hydrolysing)